MARFYFADKPSGVTTHSSHDDVNKIGFLSEINDGFCEYLADRTGERLYVVHRLDRDTTGCVCFAKSAEDAEIMRRIFAEREASKRYLFLTDHLSVKVADEAVVESFIERRGSEHVSEPPTADRPANARTVLRRIAMSHGLALWEALPETGKAHQIRLHAASLGMPILGDLAHGGSQFPQLCLHSERLEFSIGADKFTHSCPAPVWFERRELAVNGVLSRWLAAVDRRERLMRSWNDRFDGPGELLAQDLTCRWIHTEGDPLRVEQLGGVFWLSWFDDRFPGEVESGALSEIIRLKNWRPCFFQLRRDRGGARPPAGADGAGAFGADNREVPEKWMAVEYDSSGVGLKFEFRREQGLSPGLFLDQRQNRSWVRRHSHESKVLNLFCYTGGFSVAAAAGGASKVVSVDLSKSFLEWAKVNFALNGLAIDGHEFRAMDSRDYLAWAAKKGLQFELVICDPPSFSRSESGVFKIERDLEQLLTALAAVTAPGGRILFSTNYEGWTGDALEARLTRFLGSWKPAGAGRAAKFKLQRTPTPDWDFELPRERQRNMKSVFLIREN